MKGMLSLSGVCACVIAATATPASAQADVTIGYQFLHASGSFVDPRSIIDDSRNFPLGFNIDVSAPVAPHVRLVGEVNWGRHRDTFTANLNVDRTATAVGGGIRLLFPVGSARATPFVQVIAGAEHESVNDGETVARPGDSGTHFMMQPGAGLAIKTGWPWEFVAEADFRRIVADKTDNTDFGDEFRLFFGIRLDF